MLPAHTALVFGVERLNLAAGTVALLVWFSACTGRASTEAAVQAVDSAGVRIESWPADAWLWQDSLVVAFQLSITPQDSVAPGSGVRRWPMRARLTLHDIGGRILAMSPDFDGMYSGLIANGDTRLPFSNQPFTAMARDRVYFGSGARFSLAYLNSHFNWAGDIRWPSQQEALTQEEVNQVRSEAEALAATRMPPERVSARLANSFAPEILPSERPAIGRVLTAPDGNLWIERFEATRLGSVLQKAGDRWTVLAADGRPLARVTLSAGSRLEAVRDSRAILVLRDSLDVQTVAVRELRRP